MGRDGGRAADRNSTFWFSVNRLVKISAAGCLKFADTKHYLRSTEKVWPNFIGWQVSK